MWKLRDPELLGNRALVLRSASSKLTGIDRSQGDPGLHINILFRNSKTQDHVPRRHNVREHLGMDVISPEKVHFLLVMDVPRFQFPA